MKAQDLMIGDWVTGKRWIEKPFRVIRINDDGKFIYGTTATGSQVGPFFIQEIVPIPLTPEILEKNGFEPAKWKENEPAGLLGKWWDKKGAILVKRFDFTFMGEVYSVSAKNSRISNVRYIHQLQHALRLCEITKEIVV